MGVGDEDVVDRAGAEPRRREPLAESPHAEPGIDEHTELPGAHEERVALRSAGEEASVHRKRVVRTRPSGVPSGAMSPLLPTPPGALARRLAPLLPLALAACAGPDPAPSASAAAWARPQAARLAADVTWLAADAREGRRAGTAGERAAGDWLAARLAGIGLEPAGEEGSWFQPFSVPLPARDGGGSRLVQGDEVLDGPQALVPLFCSAGGKAQGPLIFAGYGIEDEALGWRDFGGAAEAARGAVVLVVRGAPAAAAQGDGERERELAARGGLFTKVMAAKHHGAGAVLVAQHPSRESEPLPRFDAGAGGRAGIPALLLSVAAAERLCPDFRARVAALDALTRHEGAPATLAPNVRVVADVLRESGTARNVLARLPGRTRRTVVVGAHYDHLGRGGPGSLDRSALGQIHNGADDNASGVAVVLEVARSLAAGPSPEGDVLFALWSGEELGLLGSEWWCEHPTVPLDRVVGYVNLDMVGRAGDRRLVVLGAGCSPAFGAWLGPAGRAADLLLEVDASPYGVGGSDHQSFVRRKIPALHLFSGIHDDYHRPSDDAERFEAYGAQRVAALTLDLVQRMLAAEALPFDEEAAREPPAEGGRRGFSVRFGSRPSYTFSGPGMKLDGTTPDSPAERAGLLAGDVIVRVGGVEIGDVHDFVYVLRTHKPGDVLEVRFVRNGEEHKTVVTLESREME